ncbi:MAG TPA: hypothetical protein VF516_05180, partial [Kofleriaceae bacterium]
MAEPIARQAFVAGRAPGGLARALADRDAGIARIRTVDDHVVQRLLPGDAERHADVALSIGIDQQAVV